MCIFKSKNRFRTVNVADQRAAEEKQQASPVNMTVGMQVNNATVSIV